VSTRHRLGLGAAASVRFIRTPIALELAPAFANARSLSSSTCVRCRAEKRRSSFISPSPLAKLNWGDGFLAISLSACYRVRPFCPDRTAYHPGIGAHLSVAFLLPSACPSPTVFPWRLAYQYPTASHDRPWWRLHWLSRITLDRSRLYANKKRPATCTQG
jgi:hypothetical protein